MKTSVSLAFMVVVLARQVVCTSSADATRAATTEPIVLLETPTIITTTTTTNTSTTTSTTSTTSPPKTWAPKSWCPKNGDPNLTIAKCQQACYDQFHTRYRWVNAGVKNGNVCWCGPYIVGNTLNAGVKESDCDVPCSGAIGEGEKKEKEICGGNGYMNIWCLRERDSWEDWRDGWFLTSTAAAAAAAAGVATSTQFSTIEGDGHYGHSIGKNKKKAAGIWSRL
ncbi:hypothetical protein B0T20DRAFT_470420 [Sordaria brevicollis]|uniref:WSC domain-containing protein n=1 Tax=Sordaria brevicollis TaxID=83679 RepID=A0AAE0PBJ3_SORBR|nr:hypothetical protein B0T20DRAFT_470420 [Sordaria brevicollis]